MPPTEERIISTVKQHLWQQAYHLARRQANPLLFEMIAAEEVGQRLVDVVENLALDGSTEEIEEMLLLMQQPGHSHALHREEAYS